jgi:hypothetical protein
MSAPLKGTASPGDGRSRVFAVAGVCCVALFAFAFVAAPHSCEWGLTAYFWAGVACVVLLAALPFARLSSSPIQRRLLIAFALGGAACASWFAGLFIANVRIMCRLF